MTQATDTTTVPAPLPEPLSQAVLDERLQRLVSMIRQHGCNDLAVALATGITDPRAGGRAVNVQHALPQMVVNFPDGHPGFDDRLDLNQNHTLEKHELTSVLLAAATMAARNNINLSQVQLDEGFINLAREKCAQVQQDGGGICRPSR